jgi:peptidoglycan hydrolase CwlO-like protein
VEGDIAEKEAEKEELLNAKSKIDASVQDIARERDAAQAKLDEIVAKLAEVTRQIAKQKNAIIEGLT